MISLSKNEFEDLQIKADVYDGLGESIAPYILIDESRPDSLVSSVDASFRKLLQFWLERRNQPTPRAAKADVVERVAHAIYTAHGSRRWPHTKAETKEKARIEAKAAIVAMESSR